MLNISLLQMKYALEVAKTGSITQAARNLYINQPSLSKSIRETEETLGFALFTRSAKGAVPTEESNEFLKMAEEVVERIEHYESFLAEIRNKNASLKISIPRASYISYAFTKFCTRIQSSPYININYSETNTNEAIDNIRSNGFDLGIIRFPLKLEEEFIHAIKRKNLSYREVYTFKYLVLLSEEHPLAKQKEIHLSDLDNMTELVHGDVYVDFISEQEINQLKPSTKDNKRIFLYERGSQFEFLRNVKDTYIWVSPLPQEVLRQNHVVQIPCLESNVIFKDVMIFDKDYQFSAYAREFMKTLQELIQELIV